jgi:hypothetical protein
MTRSLPFTVQPVRRLHMIGNEDSGIIEMPICGGLLRKEREIIESLTRADETLFVTSAKAAAKISQAEGITLSEALAALQGGEDASGALADVRLRHAEDLQKVIDASMRENERFKMATVTALMRVRGGAADWELQDWEGQPDVIIDGIYDLAQKEMTAEPSKPPAVITEEDLGKPQRAGTIRPRSTGKPATGISPTPTPDSSTAETGTGN